ncbi:hypothetical protein BJ875DRAFT_517370 [Amylocarpus encephaloides]|uniref:NACHT domain-containing protein n=1 Tax=Amylocarpus encephaloides TaxID=45428 RepID=A0A9P7YCI8_9HELO|nr:hypothetical protein BJ875DRAFT_517370 [Amylocarpus encephaloides]
MGTDDERLTPFQEAFFEWRDSVIQKKKSHKSNFLVMCNNAMLGEKGDAGAETIEEAIKVSEAKASQKTSFRIMKKVLGPVVNVLKDYYTIIESCCQADPMPSSLIWGAIKVIINGLGRYFELFEKIRGQLQMLKYQLERLQWCDELWGDSDDMQRYLCSTYVQVFRFWAAVDKECNRISLSSLMRATASFSVRKIQATIDDLGAEVDKIDKLWPIVEGRKARGERQDAERERREAGLERLENRLERKEASEFRRQVLEDQERVQQEGSYSEISGWLKRRAANGTNIKRHQENIDNRFGNTCDWLSTSEWYQNWIHSTTDTIVWLYAQPGSGKSVLCSHAMDLLGSEPEAPTIAFQFFHFDEQTTARQLLQNISSQLLEQYWSRNKCIPDNLRVNATYAADDSKNISTMIHSLILELPMVYIFLDGLDEEVAGARTKEAMKIIEYVTELTEKFPGRVRVWFSSQDRSIFRSRFQKYTIIDIQSQIHAAVQSYLCQALPGLCDLELDEPTQNWALKELQERADGHFLWATLMIKEITVSIPSISHLKSFIVNGLPRDLDDYYRRIIGRYETETEREYFSKILSIVVYARRRLTVDELIEALWMSVNGVVDRGDQIFLRFIHKLFTPLVVIDKDIDDDSIGYCRLFHSTVKDFLLKHPTIIQDLENEPDKQYLISEDTISTACLKYLQQSKYSKLLRHQSPEENESWLTFFGEDITAHHLLIYAAKFWDKHLDNSIETPKLRTEVASFLTSPNFITTIQLQSLFVEMHFSVYTLIGYSDRYKWLKRVLPEWFTTPTTGDKSDVVAGKAFAKQYRNFVSEWRWFLHRPTCGSHCRGDVYAGEIDRCLWETLGPTSFLSCRNGKYESFMLANEIATQKRLSRKKSRVIVDGFGPDGKEFAMVHFPSKMPSSEYFEFEIETWSITAGNAPILKLQQRVPFPKDDCIWQHHLKEINNSQNITLAVRFTPDLQYLRLGSQVLIKNPSGHYVQVLGADSEEGPIPWYFDDLAARGQYVVLVSRQKAPSVPKPEVVSLETDKAQPVMACNLGSDNSDSTSAASLALSSASTKTSKTKSTSKDTPVANSEGDRDQEPVDNDSDSSEANSAQTSTSYDDMNTSGDEEWTDGSTDLEKLGFAVGNADSSTSEATKSSSESPSTSSEGGSDDSSEKSDDSGESEERPRYGYNAAAEFAPYDCDSDDDQCESDQEGGFASNYFRRNKSSKKKGTLTVFDTSMDPPRKLFQYNHLFPTILNDSPPIMHPTKPLVIWPMCNGDVLFADFVAKSYFIRKFRTTSSKSRHSFMKASFSFDGAYLHLAALEWETKPNDRSKLSKKEKKAAAKATKDKAADSPGDPVLLSLFVTTHRLSQSKTTRSPPSLIHRVKVILGAFVSIPSGQFPLFLTWTPTHLYATFSRHLLRVLKIELFPKTPSLKDLPSTSEEKTASASLITVPQSNIYLPDSSRVREIYYYPPTSTSLEGPGTVMIGSLNPIAFRNIKEMKVYRETPMHSEPLPDVTSPPIGLFVKDEDLGGWKNEADRVAEVRRRAGRAGAFERKIEKFDANDDCDVELYLGAEG